MDASLCMFPNSNPTAGVMPDISQHVDHHQHHQTSSEFQFSDYFMMQDYYSFDQDAHLASQNTVDQYQQNVTSNITVESNHPSATASNMQVILSLCR